MLYGSPIYGGVDAGQNIYPSGITSSTAVGKPSLTAPTKSRIREYPPLRLSVNVETPDGHSEYWASTVSDPRKAVSGLSFSTTIPGGFEHADMTLVRDTRRSYADLEELEKLTIRGVGGSVAWQGRLETAPSVSGDSLSITPGAVGYQAHLDDDSSLRELFVGIDFGQWQAGSVQRKINLLNANADVDDATARGEPSGTPSLDCELSGPWSRTHIAEAWFDAKGVPIGAIFYAWELGASGQVGVGSPVPANGSYTDTNWLWQVGLSKDDVATTYQASNNLRAAGPGSAWFYPTADLQAPWAFAQLVYSGAGGASGVLYDVYWTKLWLYGTQGFATYNTADNTLGLLGSDILKFAIAKYAPKLKTSFAGQPTIYNSNFVIPHLVYLDPTAVSQVVKDVTAYELQDWAVWEGPTFWWYPRYAIGKKWRARVAPAKLQQAGPQIDRLWNGVIVQFTDELGVSRTAGPPGSGSQYINPELADNDPLSPLNQAGIRKWGSLQMSGTAMPSAAVQIGKIFLQEQKLLNTSGAAQLTGYVEDDSGVLWPAWKPRAGDRISFVDANDTSYRRIVSTNYNDDSRTNQITLDTPPDTLQAILARLQVVLAPITGG